MVSSQQLENSALAPMKGRGRSNSDASIQTEATVSTSDSSGESVEGPKPRVRKQNYRKKNSRRRKQQSPRVDKENFIAMDCEMVGIGPNGYQSAVARVSLVDWDGKVVLDVYVQPSEPVTDYRTFVSGVKAEDLIHGITLGECRMMVSTAVKGKILVGHGLKCDLKALDYSHPWHMIRDTAKYEPFMKTRYDGTLGPRKLSDLSNDRLKRTIQLAQHSPIEDATAAFDLYKSVRSKWEKAMEYKVVRTQQIEEEKRLPTVQ